ncbi:MAG: T9SS type A sorting domain-containing protein [Bacteroidota bacterium]
MTITVTKKITPILKTKVFILLLFSSFLATAQIQVFNSNGGPFVAFGAAPGTIGVEDYIAVTDGLPHSDSLNLESFLFVGGVIGDGLGGEISFFFYDSDTLIYDSLFVNLPQDGAFLWTITTGGITIPSEGFFQAFVDTNSVVNAGRNMTGQWFICNTDSVTNFVGSSPGNIFGLPPDGASPRVFAFDFNVTQEGVHTATADACTTADSNYVSAGEGTFKPIYHSGELIASINDGGNSLGQTDIDFYISSTDRQYPTGFTYLNRTLFITPANNNAATVRMYIPDSELQALISATAADPMPVTGIGDITLNKVDGVTCGSGYDGSGGGSVVTINQLASGSYGTDWYVDFQVPGFSAFNVSGGDVVLPIELQSLDIETNENSFTLNWITASEINNSGFEIERSMDGERFESVGFVSGSGTISELQEYQFEDKGVMSNTYYYYRLKQIDFNGNYSNSQIVSGIIENEKSLSLGALMPNPAKSFTQLPISIGSEQNVNITIINMAGQLVQDFTEQMQVGLNQIQLDLTTMAKGNYLIQVRTQNNVEVKRLVIE